MSLTDLVHEHALAQLALPSQRAAEIFRNQDIDGDVLFVASTETFRETYSDLLADGDEEAGDWVEDFDNREDAPLAFFVATPRGTYLNRDQLESLVEALNDLLAN